MNKCATCKHLGGKDPRGLEFYWCNLIEHIDSHDAPSTGRKAFTQDAEDYSSCLMVSLDFGCNQWAAK